MKSIETLSGPALVKLFNALTSGDVKRFETRTAGVKRITDCMTEKGLDEAALHEVMIKAGPSSEASFPTPEASTPAANTAKPDDAAAKPKSEAPRFPKPGTKPRMIVDLVCREGGATMAELIAATGWQRCSGTLSTLNRTFGLGVQRRRSEDGVTRFYGVLPAAGCGGEAA